MAGRGGRRRGFTLLEMLITLTVTTVGLTGLLFLHVVTVKSNELGSRDGEAIAVAQRTLETYRSRSADDLRAEFNVAELPIDAALDTAAGRAGTTYGRRLRVTELTATSTSLIKLRVEVTWTDDRAQPGAQGGALDHRISLELIRTVEEAL